MTPVLGIDAGTVRVGLAVSDPTCTIATPLTTLRCDRPAALWQGIATALTEHAVDRIVIGLPRQLDGDEGAAAEMARRFGDEVASRTDIPIEWWDERFTTQAAERSLISSGLRRARRRQVIDAVAAALMLQSWLDAHPSTMDRGCAG